MLKKLGVSAFLLCIYTTQAIAAGGGEQHGDAHQTDAAGHGEAASGLPQLDTSTYFGQGFWLVIVFTIMYFFYSRKALPVITRTIENRAERVNSDLDSAERLKDEVASVQKSYEEKLAETREEASTLYFNIEKEIKEKSEKHTHDFQKRSSEKVKALESNIDNARNEAMKEMIDVAAGVAIQAAEKIIGVSTGEDEAKKIVKSINSAA